MYFSDYYISQIVGIHDGVIAVGAWIESHGGLFTHRTYYLLQVQIPEVRFSPKINSFPPPQIRIYIYFSMSFAAKINMILFQITETEGLQREFDSE